MTNVLYTAFDIVPSPKGASTHILHNLRGLVNGNFHVHLITPNDGLLPPEDTIEGALVTRISQDLSQNFLARAVHFGKSVLSHLALHSDYDVVHFRNIWDGFHITQNKKKFGYKTLFEVNGLPSIELKYHYPGMDSELLAKIKEQEIATLHLSDAIICPSNVTRDYIASLGLSRKLVTVIPNGVSPSDFPVTPLPPRGGREPVLLYIGTLADWQGLDIVIKALPKILEQQPVKLQIIGHGRSTLAHCHDDGEPAGTAGRPMLAVLQGSGLGDVVAVVTRYFGGTKLGTGGLVRAYGDAVRAALVALPRAEKVATTTVMVEFPYSLLERVRQLVESHDGIIIDEQFAAAITLTARFRSERFPEFAVALRELSHGSVEAVVVETNEATIMPL